jgi:hypothetical protein
MVGRAGIDSNVRVTRAGKDSHENDGVGLAECAGSFVTRVLEQGAPALFSALGIVSAVSVAGCPAASPDTTANGAHVDASPATSPPVLAVGLDAYREWDRLPYIRIGARTYMRSTYDRAGGNAAADASHYLREVAPGDDVALDVAGRGLLYFFRANHWHGSPWHFGIDGDDFVVSETATATPDAPPATSTFLPAASFPSPLALTYATTQGSDVSWVPMGFTSSLSLAHGHSHYGTGYFIYTLYDPSAALSQPIAAWSEPDETTGVASDVLTLLSSAGSDIGPMGAGVRSDTGSVVVPASGAVTVLDLAGPAVVRVVRFVVPTSSAHDLETAHLRIAWDGHRDPSVDAPVPLFFGTGTFVNRANAEFLVKSLPAVVRFTGSTLELSMFLPMPFQRSARIELVGGGAAVPGVTWQVRSTPYTDAPNEVGYFHATYVDHGTPTPGKDLVFLDTTQAEGGGDTCGSFVGTSFTFSDAAVLGTLEGDPRFFFDDSETPQAQGTGTEEWGAGGDYWMGGLTTTLALAGHPVGAPSPGAATEPEDMIESAYRFLLADAFPFGKNARIQLEHGGTDESTEHYRSVAYWYGTPSACLTETDSLHVSDVADEAAHAYMSSEVGVDTVTSRYELGVDHIGATQVYPATTDTGRHGTGAVELDLSVSRENLGVLLRRKLDYSFADQRADVFVADASKGAGGAFASVGPWYLAGSNTCAFVDAPTETSQTAPVVETSNRRWRDDEILLPRTLTRGRSRIRVRIVPSHGSTWSAFRYTAYSYGMPAAP